MSSWCFVMLARCVLACAAVAAALLCAASASPVVFGVNRQSFGFLGVNSRWDIVQFDLTSRAPQSVAPLFTDKTRNMDDYKFYSAVNTQAALYYVLCVKTNSSESSQGTLYTYDVKQSKLVGAKDVPVAGQVNSAGTLAFDPSSGKLLFQGDNMLYRVDPSSPSQVTTVATLWTNPALLPGNIGVFDNASRIMYNYAVDHGNLVAYIYMTNVNTGVTKASPPMPWDKGTSSGFAINEMCFDPTTQTLPVVRNSLIGGDIGYLDPTSGTIKEVWDAEFVVPYDKPEYPAQVSYFDASSKTFYVFLGTSSEQSAEDTWQVIGINMANAKVVSTNTLPANTDISTFGVFA